MKAIMDLKALSKSLQNHDDARREDLVRPCEVLEVFSWDHSWPQ